MRTMNALERSFPWAGLLQDAFGELAEAQKQVSLTDSGFSVGINVGEFKPEDLKISLVDRMLTVNGEHNEETEEGSVRRSFSQSFHVPENVDIEQFSSHLSEDGKLCIEAPLVAPKPLMRTMNALERSFPCAGLLQDAFGELAEAQKQVSLTDNGFSVDINVGEFKPEELKISLVDRMLTVNGEHNEETEEGSVRRSFSQSFHVPENVDIEQFSSHLSEDGKLCIEAPLVAPKPMMRTMNALERSFPCAGLLQDAFGELAEAQKQVSLTDNGFTVGINVGEFKPEELKISLVDRMVTVNGEHNEETEEGSVRRSFYQSFRIPENVDIEQFSSHLSEDGKLSIEAPLIAPKPVEQSRAIPIERVASATPKLADAPEKQ
ncbi:unnamed protein product, partial [Mesorhabditis spiculigera]